MSREKCFDSILFSGFRFPQVGDKPFDQSDIYLQSANINRFGHFRLEFMIEGYKQGADLMVERALEDRVALDVLIFPIIFCYRHYIELSLKHLIANYGPIVGVSSSWKTHDLSTLWNTVKIVAKNYGVEDEDNPESIVTHIITEFEKLDRGSFSFRYPFDKEGSLIELGLESCDLVNLANVMKGLEGYLDGLNGLLDNLKNASDY